MKLAWDAKNRVDSRDGGYHRERSDDLYHSSRWTRLARAYLMSHPLCAECGKQGIIKAAQCVDHVIPWPVWKAKGGDFFDETNLQPLCFNCNQLKGQRDKRVIEKYGR